jgi:hypothetical protein
MSVIREVRVRVPGTYRATGTPTLGCNFAWVFVEELSSVKLYR